MSLSNGEVVLAVCFTLIILGFLYVIQRAHADVSAVARQALVLRGLDLGVNPHVVDPVKFGPTGMAREDEQDAVKREKAEMEEARALAETAQSAYLESEKRALRDAELRYFAQQSRDPVSGGRGGPAVGETT